MVVVFSDHATLSLTIRQMKMFKCAKEKINSYHRVSREWFIIIVRNYFFLLIEIYEIN